MYSIKCLDANPVLVVYVLSIPYLQLTTDPLALIHMVLFNFLLCLLKAKGRRGARAQGCNATVVSSIPI